MRAQFPNKKVMFSFVTFWFWLFVGCSEISINVIVKHVQIIGIISAFCLPEDLLSISVPWGTNRFVGLWIARGDQCPG